MMSASSSGKSARPAAIKEAVAAAPSSVVATVVKGRESLNVSESSSPSASGARRCRRT